MKLGHLDPFHRSSDNKSCSDILRFQKYKSILCRIILEYLSTFRLRALTSIATLINIKTNKIWCPSPLLSYARSTKFIETLRHQESYISFFKWKMKMKMILYFRTSHIKSTTSTKEKNICLPIQQFHPVVSNLRQQSHITRIYYAQYIIVR